MKAWFNKKRNWCFEFEQDELETMRLSQLVSEGTRYWRDHRDEFPKAFISASLFNAALGVIFIGQNYSQSNPTIKNPIVVKAEKLAKNAIVSQEKMGWNAEHFNEKELELLKKLDVKELL